jgi:hypothetical protein
MKCFALWVNDNGSSMVAELSPEQGQSLIEQVEPQPAASPDEAISALQDMMGSGEDMAEQEMMRGYSKGKTAQATQGKMSMSKVFGDE